jgi:hypothetical protein
MGEFTDDTGFLYPSPSFLSGWAAVLDFAGTLNVYNVSKSGQEADARALASDWAIVGKDIQKAIKRVDQKEAQRQSAK